MPGPSDFKVLVKQVVTDPLGLNLPTLPSSAIVVGIASGNQGNRTGVYGRSERSVAIYGESPVFAGFFEGDVYVNGGLEVTGDIRGPAMDKLLQRMAGFESSVKQQATRIEILEASQATHEGRTSKPATRPRPTLDLSEMFFFQNRANFRLVGSGFAGLKAIVLRVFNNSTGRDATIFGGNPNAQNLGTEIGSTDAGGNLATQAQLSVDCRVGDELRLVATDLTSDSKDSTGLLWSTTVTRQAQPL
jgi:hypothetical protein